MTKSKIITTAALREFIIRRVKASLKEINESQGKFKSKRSMASEGVSDGDKKRGSSTFGVIPSPKELQVALDEEGGWSMNLRGSDAEAFDFAMDAAGMDSGRAEGMMSNGMGMYKVLQALMDTPVEGEDEDGNTVDTTDIADNAQSLASGILDVLGFEWI